MVLAVLTDCANEGVAFPVESEQLTREEAMQEYRSAVNDVNTTARS